MKTIQRLFLLAGASGNRLFLFNSTARRAGCRPTRQHPSFQDLRITKLCKEQCRFVESTTVRIYLQLSAPPPVGWSYLFSCVWQATAYPWKRCVGLEGDMIGIECALEEMEPHHLEGVEKAVSQTNANYRDFMQRQAAAEQQRNERNARLQAQLDELGDYLDSSADSTMASDNPEAIRPSLSGSVIGLLRGLLGIPARNEGEMVSHGA